MKPDSKMSRVSLTRPGFLAASEVAAQDYLRLVEDSVDFAICLLDTEGRLLTWNEGARRLFGYEPSDIIGAPLSVLYSEEDCAAGKPELALSNARMASRVESDGCHVRQDGSRVWVNLVLSLRFDERGEASGFGLIMRERAEPSAETRLRHNGQRFHELVDAIDDYSIVLLDVEGRIVTWNSGARKIEGYEADEVVGHHFSLFFPPEARASDRPGQVLAAVQRHGRHEEEGYRLRKDGVRFWAHVIITALRDESGQVIGFAKVTRDLTARRAAEEQLRQSEERFRLLVESVGDYAIYMLSPSGDVQTWNIGAERMKGYAASEIIGKNFERFFPEEDQRGGKPQAELAKAAAAGRFEDEGYRVRKDGTLFWANVVVTAIRDSRGDLLGFAKVTRDLTARREAEETARQLARAQAARALAEAVARKADEASRVKDEFLAMVSHELRTPLNAIVGWAAILRQRELEPSLARAVEVIERNAHAQVKIIEDILDISRVITGKLRIDPKPTDLVTIVHQALDVVRHSASAKQIRVEFAAGQGACPLVADAERLQQVVWNLLSNAIKFTGSGGAVSVSIECKSDMITLRVSDTGIGIDAELLPYLFERFRQGDSSSTRRFGGLGLGLALVRHIVELHGGTVAVASAGKGQGSTFSLSLPRNAAAVPVPASERVAADSEAMPRRSAAVLRGLRVLVVEDDPDARELVGAILAEAGAEVASATSAADGFEAVRRFRPHILISDIAMPDEDGYSLIRRVRALDTALGGTLVSVALTAHTRAEDRTKALAAGFTTHIGKPVNPADLVSALVNLGALARR